MSARRYVGGILATALIAGAAVALPRHSSPGPRRSQPDRPPTLAEALRTVATGTSFYLKLPGVPGESTDPGHVDQIGVKSIAWGVVNTPVSSGGSGKGVFDAVEIEKDLDASSPKLMKAAAASTTFPTAVVLGDKTASTTIQYFELDLTDVKVTSFKESGDSEGVQDTVKFSFQSIRLKYTRQSSSGGPSTVYQACWNLESNTSC
jgi:type VI secretion system secreted protein Hcp